MNKHGLNSGDFGRVPPCTFKDGILVDATGEPVPPLPKSKRKSRLLNMGGPAKLRKKPNPRMITSDFDGRSEDE